MTHSLEKALDLIKQGKCLSFSCYFLSSLNAYKHQFTPNIVTKYHDKLVTIDQKTMSSYNDTVRYYISSDFSIRTKKTDMISRFSETVKLSYPR